MAPENLERMQRLVSAPWLQTYLAANLASAEMTKSLNAVNSLALQTVSDNLKERLEQMFKATTPKLSQLSQLDPQILDVVKRILESSRGATFAGFAKKLRNGSLLLKP